MSLFTEQSGSTDPQDEGSPRSGRGRRVGWILISVAILILVVLGIAPAPYVIEKPGPVFNTLGETTHNGTEVPLITIPDQKTYPTSGSLDMLTVSQVGSPSQRPSWAEVAAAWFNPSQAVVPIDSVFSPNVSNEQVEKENQTLMIDSQQDAIAAALVQLGYDFPRDVTVSGVSPDSPADGVLQENDVITSVNGTAVHDVDALRTAVKANGTDKPAQVAIVRDGQASVVEVTPTSIDGAVVLGVGVHVVYTFPFEVDIRLDNVGGPSAGQMFALGIIDKLTPGYLNGGESVAGTGTIDSAGNVGAIGGIRQKMFGARDAGAKYFLAPSSNCDEVVGHVPGGLQVFSVKTLDDAMNALEAVADGSDTSSLPTCAAG